MLNKNSKVLFLGKSDDTHTQRALDFLTINFNNVQSHFGVWGDKIPQEALNWRGDLIISYLSRWVIPETLTSRAEIASINFHPASPDYPGIGCNNFALYDGASNYGVTCHHMAKTVDTGKIIAVKDFPLTSADTVETLLPRIYDFQLVLFYDVIVQALKTGELPSSTREWTRKPYSRKEFNELFIVTSDMSAEEVNKRIRAVSYGKFQPYMKVNGKTFKYSPE